MRRMRVERAEQRSLSSSSWSAPANRTRAGRDSPSKSPGIHCKSFGGLRPVLRSCPFWMSRWVQRLLHQMCRSRVHANAMEAALFLLLAFAVRYPTGSNGRARRTLGWLWSGMGDSRTYSGAPSAVPVHAASTSQRSDVGRAAVAVAVIAAVLTWVAVVVSPWAARAAAARGDYDNVYTIPIVAVVVVLVLDALAVILGFIGVRQPTAKALSGAAIGIGAMGMFGVLIYVIGTFFIMPRIG